MVLAGERYKRTTANIGPCYGQLWKPDLLSQAVRVSVVLWPLSYVLRYPGCITPLPLKTFLLNTERNLRRWLGPAHLLTQPGPKDNGESEVFQPGSPGGYSLSYPRLRWPHCLWLL